VFVYTVTNSIESDLCVLESLKQRLDFRATLSRRWMGRLRRELAASSIAASTSMEGVRVDVQDVRRLLVGDAPADVTPDDAALVEGYRQAMEFALVRADARAFEWSSDLVLALQNFVLARSFARGAGKFREGTVRIADATGGTKYLPPGAEDVSALMLELMTWANEAADVPAAIVSAMVHVGVAAIHPFRDGNGRTARVCAALAMLRGGYRAPEFTSLEEWWGSHLGAYYSSFDCLGPVWDGGADVTRFIAAHVGAQRRQAQTVAVRQVVERQLWGVLEDIVEEDLSGPSRWSDALFDAFMCRPITNRYYRGVVDIEIAAASSDLAKLRTAGVLAARGAGGGREYVGAPRLYRLVAERLGLAAELEADASEDQSRDHVLAALAQQARDEDEFVAREPSVRYGAQ
jgi:hypothetical protein